MSRADRTIRWSTAIAVLGIAVVAWRHVVRRAQVADLKKGQALVR